MLCAGQGEFQRVADRREGWLSRLFGRVLGCGRSDAFAQTDRGFVWVSKAGTTILGRGELCVVNMIGRCKIYCSKGAVWVTCSGLPRDHILDAGENLLLMGEGKIIISGGSEKSLVRISNE